MSTSVISLDSTGNIDPWDSTEKTLSIQLRSLVLIPTASNGNIDREGKLSRDYQLLIIDICSETDVTFSHNHQEIRDVVVPLNPWMKSLLGSLKHAPLFTEASVVRRRWIIPISFIYYVVESSLTTSRVENRYTHCQIQNPVLCMSNRYAKDLQSRLK